jgi:hypothetical protein
MKVQLSTHQRMVIVKGICAGVALRDKEPVINKDNNGIIEISHKGVVNIWDLCAISCDAEAFGLKAKFHPNRIEIIQES